MNQPGILSSVPRLARYLTFSLIPGADPMKSLEHLATMVDDDKMVVGLGESLLVSMGVDIPGMRCYPQMAGSGIDLPSTPCSLWVWLRGDDRGELVHRTRAISQFIAAAFLLEEVIDSFQYGESMDLTGYIDGTENPEGDAALEAAFVSNEGSGMNGGSFVAVQQWVHDLDSFGDLELWERDSVIGRRIRDNVEIEDAPESAHVKRTAQENFDPEAFILRRSMPWADAACEGLVFVAFGKSFDAFEALLRRMVGLDDGIRDALLSYSRPVTGSYFWCPPVRAGQLDLECLRG
ncbi:MAG: putative iron-dependent peroxidase [Planctomycetota bacterium]|jgi:putative iron-dependent peroxidase